jgi:DNA-binding transcriptional ArsR family regulator
MASAFPHRTPVDHAPREETSIEVTRDEQTDVLGALSSETAQQILATLGDEPATASDVAGAVDISLQNVNYHLDSLREAGLVEPVETWYSAKGREMTVYALTTERLVFRFGDAAGPSSS